MTWRASVLTLFPEMFPGPLTAALAGRALRAGIWSLATRDLREYGRGRRVDDAPFGGGSGMVLRPEVVAAAVADEADGRPLVCLAARGRAASQADVARIAAGPGVVLLCGRYEGIDQRALEAAGAEEFAVGDFVLSGGELPALLLLDAVIRLLPGVMGDAASAEDESFARGLLEYPHYTRPARWEGRAVPPVLLSGDHARIAAWRQAQAEATTRERRPDLWAAYSSGICAPGALAVTAFPESHTP